MVFNFEKKEQGKNYREHVNVSWRGVQIRTLYVCTVFLKHAVKRNEFDYCYIHISLLTSEYILK